MKDKNIIRIYTVYTGNISYEFKQENYNSNLVYAENKRNGLKLLC